MEDKNMNKYLVVFQFSDGSIYNRILKAEKITEEVIKVWTLKTLNATYRVTKNRKRWHLKLEDSKQNI